MGRCRRFKQRSPLRRGRATSLERALDADTFKDSIGTAIYDRVMQWNDSGAAEALLVAEQRRKALEVRKPCWLPKLNDDLYIGNVDWNAQQSGEVCNMAKSAVAFLNEPSCELYGAHSLPKDIEQPEQISPVPDIHVPSGGCNDRVILEGSVDTPLMVDAVLEHCADGLRLLVGGWPVEPSGWDEGNSQCVDRPWIVEAVLEDFGEGQRLLVGGWPIQPSWDELDTNWSQLGWDGHTGDANRGCNTQAQSSRNGNSSASFPQQQLGWQNSWCSGNVSNSLHHGQNYMMAF